MCSSVIKWLVRRFNEIAEYDVFMRYIGRNKFAVTVPRMRNDTLALTARTVSYEDYTLTETQSRLAAMKVDAEGRLRVAENGITAANKIDEHVARISDLLRQNNMVIAG